VNADPNLRFYANPVVYGILDLLLAPKKTLCRLLRYVPEKELDLFEVATYNMTEVGARAAKVVRGHLVPLDEVSDRKFVGAPGFRGRQAV
jgi:hypothetical protein